MEAELKAMGAVQLGVRESERERKSCSLMDVDGKKRHQSIITVDRMRSSFFSDACFPFLSRFSLSRASCFSFFIHGGVFKCSVSRGF